MADFDFDELDRAVAGALGTSPTPASPSEPPRTEPVTPAPASTQTPPTPAPAARRSAGRFMDMVHPTSDMRSSRPEAASQPEPMPQATSSPSSDPFTSSFEDLPSTPEEVSKPLESPFLPDAKVEKRPLGGVGIFPPEPSSQAPTNESPAPFVPTEPGELPVDDSDVHTMPDPIDFALQNQPAEEPKPAEISQPEQALKEEQVVSEPETTPELDEAPFVDAEPAQLEEQLASIEAETVEIPSEVDTTHPRPETPTEQAPAEPTPTGPTSISQQYQEQPSSAAESGAIFDTEAYHQPLMHHAPKKKSGVMVIVWILVLILIGAGAGVAFYLYILPTL